MSKTKILFVTQEMIPYMPETEIAKTCRELPQAIQERGHEIRTFMPKYGSINERRNQLHEVIRLSGMNLIIDDTDHPLIIKVASIQAARMQVYFTDNDDYFQRKVGEVMDEANREDNDERSIFYARGVLETVKNYDGNPISSTVTDGYLLWCHYMSKNLMPTIHASATRRLCSRYTTTPLHVPSTPVLPRSSSSAILPKRTCRLLMVQKLTTAPLQNLQ